jgi:hypothetical protein
MTLTLSHDGSGDKANKLATCQLMAGGCLPEVVALFGFERGA